MNKHAKRLTRRTFLSNSAAVGIGAAFYSRASSQAAAALEKTELRIGAAITAAVFLPVYLAANQTWKAEGLNASLASFRGDPELAQALVGDSVDIALVPGDTIVSMVNAKSDCIGFYAGFNAADFAWVANPSIKSWNDTKGTSVAITSYGALTDQIARYMLKKQGLAALTDVQIIAGGPPASMFQLLKAGRAQSAILAPPFVARAKSEGFTVLGTQAEIVGPQWPKEVFVARKKFIEENPRTLEALLRAHVSAIRLLNSDSAIATSTLVQTLKFTPEVAQATYEEIRASYDESGNLPQPNSMASFWNVMKESGKVTEAWPNSAILDDRFIRTFSSWAPKR